MRSPFPYQIQWLTFRQRRCFYLRMWKRSQDNKKLPIISCFRHTRSQDSSKTFGWSSCSVMSSFSDHNFGFPHKNNSRNPLNQMNFPHWTIVNDGYKRQYFTSLCAAKIHFLREGAIKVLTFVSHKNSQYLHKYAKTRYFDCRNIEFSHKYVTHYSRGFIVC